MQTTSRQSTDSEVDPRNLHRLIVQLQLRCQTLEEDNLKLQSALQKHQQLWWPQVVSVLKPVIENLQTGCKMAHDALKVNKKEIKVLHDICKKKRKRKISVPIDCEHQQPARKKMLAETAAVQHSPATPPAEH